MGGVLGVAMIAGPLLAGGVQAGQQATELNNACSGLEDATTKYNTTKAKWGNLVSNIENEYDQIYAFQQEYGKQLNSEYQLYSEKLKAYKDIFKKQQWEKEILFAIFIFCIIITLLFKYFKVFPTLWAYISGK